MIRKLFKSKPPKQSCVNCHFLMKRHWEVTLQNRMSIKNNDFSCFGGGEKEFLEPSCYHKVWKMPYDGKFDARKEILEINRKGICYFWQYIPTMSFETGNDLRNKEISGEEKSLDRKFVIISLMIAGLSLITSLISLYYSLQRP